MNIRNPIAGVATLFLALTGCQATSAPNGALVAHVTANFES